MRYPERFTALILTAIISFAAAQGGEAVFINGSMRLAVPDGWTAKAAGSTTTISPEGAKDFKLVFDAPRQGAAASPETLV